ERQNGNLRRARLARLIFFSAAHKCDVTAILRPARIRVVLAVGHANGSFISRGRYRPDGGFIACTLFVDDYTRQCTAAPVMGTLQFGARSTSVEAASHSYCPATHSAWRAPP